MQFIYSIKKKERKEMAYINVAEWLPDQVTDWLKGMLFENHFIVKSFIVIVFNCDRKKFHSTGQKIKID